MAGLSNSVIQKGISLLKKFKKESNKSNKKNDEARVIQHDFV
jgi:hypothetical protein